MFAAVLAKPDSDFPQDISHDLEAEQLCYIHLFCNHSFNKEFHPQHLKIVFWSLNFKLVNLPRHHISEEHLCHATPLL